MQTPVSLVMRTDRCFYCPAYGCTQTEIIQNFGIFSCAPHDADATRDCNAYLHRLGRVRLGQARIHPALKPFFDALPPEFPTVRKSGLVDPGWSILEGTEQFLFRDGEGVWCIRLRKNSEGLERGATLKSFLDAGVPGITADLVSGTLAALEAGIYAADVAAQAGLELEVVKESPGVQLEMYNGVLCRMFKTTS